jgi:hypothetical protein
MIHTEKLKINLQDILNISFTYAQYFAELITFVGRSTCGLEH